MQVREEKNKRLMMKGQISCTRKPQLSRATLTEHRMNVRGSWLQRQKEKHDESQSPRSLIRKQAHSSGKTNYFLAPDSKGNLSWRTLHKVHEYVYLTQISSVSHGIYLPFREVNFRTQQVDSVSSNLQCQCAVKQLLPIPRFTGPSINIWSNWAKVSNCP